MILKLLVSIIIGAISGWFACKLMKTNCTLIKNIILGIIGGFVGDLIFELLGVSFSGILGTIIVSIVGACLVLFIVNKIAR